CRNTYCSGWDIEFPYQFNLLFGIEWMGLLMQIKLILLGRNEISSLESCFTCQICNRHDTSHANTGQNERRIILQKLLNAFCDGFDHTRPTPFSLELDLASSCA